MKEDFEEIFAYVKDLRIIDTHEHLPYSESAREKDTDVLKEYLSHYFNRDLISAGLTIDDYNKIMDNKLPIVKKWEMVEPYWKVARYTGYGRALDASVRALYGIEGISRSTIEELNQAFLKSLEPGHFRRVLKEKSKIEVSLLDRLLEEKQKCDHSFFRCVHRMDPFIYPRTGIDIKEVEKTSGIRICSFQNWLDACEVTLDKALKSGAVALKSGLAYCRTLKYERVRRDDAEEGFNQIFKTKHIVGQVFIVGKKFQDYMMHFILGLANKKNLIFQFHTGIQEGSGNIIRNSDPSLMTNLFLEYPDVNFDIFHISYPFQQVLSVLAKNFPNVYIDMCWAHVISPTASINALAEWIDSVPVNKISAFGGDYCFIDGVYGHQYLARINVSKSLARKVEEGVFDIAEAKRISEMLFYKNPVKIFKLEGKI